MKKIRKILALSMAMTIGSSLYSNNFSEVKADVVKENKVSEKPNIIFFLVDDMGYTDTSLYGSEYYETPNLERLAEKGIMFTDSYAGSNLCSPSRATILTGRFPNRTGINRLCNPNNLAYETGENQTELINQNGYLVAPEPTFLPKDEITIPEMLKTKGYTSAHIGKWHLGDPTKGYGPLEQGYDINIGGTHNGHPPSYFSPYMLSTLPDGENGEYITDRLTDEAVNFIKENKDEPFFLNLAHYAVHTPLQAKADIIEKYKNKPRSEYHHNPIYAAMIESVDDSLGRIMDTVEELGIDDNTIIVFASDNGGIHYWNVSDNYPLREGKCYQYEGGIRIPTVISWPAVTKGGTVSDERIHHSDYFPTFCEAAGVELPNDRVIDGESLMPVLSGEGGLKRETLYWYNPHFNPDSGTTVVPASAIIDGDYKLIKHYASNPYSNGDLYELFDLSKDISESNNLMKSMPEKAKELEAKLNKYMIETDAVIPVKVSNNQLLSEALRLPQSKMTVKATSEETSSEKSPATNAIDGNKSTIWHTNYSSSQAQLPQSITIDLGSQQNINKVTYLPRQDNSSNGNITNYKIYVSTDGENYNHVTTGTWANDKTEKIVEFEAIEARYVKIRATGSVGNFVSASEINVYKFADIESISNTEVTTQEGLNPMMPETVEANIIGGEKINLNVVWDKISEDSFKNEGEFKVEGTINGTQLRANATVKVEKQANPKDVLVTEYKSFDGNAGKGFIKLENSEELRLNDEVTVEFKVMPEKYDGRLQHLISKIDEYGNGFKIVLSSDKKVVFTSEGIVKPNNASIPWRMVESESEIPVNEWTNIRISFSKRLNRVRLYVNDILEVEKRVLAPIADNTAPILLGADINSNNKLDGKLESIKFYNTFIQEGLEDEVVGVNPDFNNDGRIDIGDLAIVSKNYGSNKTEYDLNGDGIVDIYEINYIMQEILK